VKTGEPQGKVSTDADKKTQRLLQQALLRGIPLPAPALALAVYTRGAKGKLPLPIARWRAISLVRF